MSQELVQRQEGAVDRQCNGLEAADEAIWQNPGHPVDAGASPQSCGLETAAKLVVEQQTRSADAMLKNRERWVTSSVEDWGWTSLTQAALHFSPRQRRQWPEPPNTAILFLWGNFVPTQQKPNVARYAIPRDYHKLLGAELEAMTERLQEMFPQERFAWYCDVSPLSEVWAAQQAGLGEKGRHGMLLHPRLGSHLHIGEILTSLELPLSGRQAPQCCRRCERCVRVCPTGALGGGDEPGFCKDLCQSHLTQQKGELSERTKAIIRKTGVVWGCDLCAQACPCNADPRPARLEGFYRDRQEIVTKEQAKALCVDHAYGWRGPKVLLRNLAVLEEE